MRLGPASRVQGWFRRPEWDCRIDIDPKLSWSQGEKDHSALSGGPAWAGGHVTTVSSGCPHVHRGSPILPGKENRLDSGQGEVGWTLSRVKDPEALQWMVQAVAPGNRLRTL